MTDLTIIWVVLLPWLFGTFIIWKSESVGFDWHVPTSENKGGTRGGSYIWRMWGFLLILVCAPFIWWFHDCGDSVVYVLQETYDRTSKVVLQSLRYTAPFAAYPIIVFWLKVIANYRADQEETGTWGSMLHTRNSQQQRQQAQLITFAIKTLVLVFVFFDVLNGIGIATSEVLQITTGPPP